MKTLNKETEKILTTQLNIGGMYQHYSGKKYKVMGIFRHSEDLVLYVAYVGQYEDAQYGTNWIRPLDMFLEEVEIQGKQQPRFKYLP